MLPKLQAYAKGKDLQLFHGGEWHNYTGELNIEISPALIRVKPEPRVIYITEVDGDLDCSDVCDRPIPVHKGNRLIKFIEEV